jgi:flagellar motor switch protein FliG
MREKVFMNNILFEIWVKDRLIFSDRERRECFETAHEIVRIAQDVRKNGLLSIDSEIPLMSDKFLQRAMQLGVDSTDPELIEKIMQTWIVYGNYSGSELLKRIIIIEGVLAIVYGENPYQIMHKLAAYIGEDLYDEYMKAYKIFEEHNKAFNDTVAEFLSNLNDAPPESLNEFEKLIAGMDNMAMQTINRCTYEQDIRLVLKNAPKQVAKRFLDNMSKRVAQSLVQDSMYLKDIKASDVTGAQNKILETIAGLEKRGEIVIAKK